MRISVITVCHNSEKYLEHTIRSVITQTHKDLEYIIVDGNSEDGTKDVIRSFGSSVTKWISEPDNGLYDALNKGLAMATGDVIGFLHSDDFFVRDTVLSSIAGAFERNICDSVYGDIQYVDPANTDQPLTNRKAGKFRRYRLLLGWSPPHPTFYVKRTVYEQFGGFDTSFSIAGDYDSMIRFLAKRQITAIYVPEVLVRMRVGGISNRTMQLVRRKWKEDYRAMRENGFGNPITAFLKMMRPVAHFAKSPKYLFD
jgi:glycosyltransferase